LLNNSPVKEKQACKKRIIYAPCYDTSHTYTWTDEQVKNLEKKLSEKFQVFPPQGSFAYNYCLVAEGEFDGVVSLTKDAFPEFAGCYIANKAGYIATNIKGEKVISHTDRIFVCGDAENHAELLAITRSIICEMQLPDENAEQDTGN